MKNSFYALLLPTLILIACENSDNIDLPNYVLSSETTYLHASQGIDTVTLYYTYNQGKLILTEDYTNNAKQPSTHEFFYDMNDRLLNSHMVTYGRFDTKFQETFYSYVYNEEGKIASQIMDSLIQYFGGPITVTIPDQEDYQYAV